MENHHLDAGTAARCRDAYRERFRTVGLFENGFSPRSPPCCARSRIRGTSYVRRHQNLKILRLVS